MRLTRLSYLCTNSLYCYIRLCNICNEGISLLNWNLQWAGVTNRLLSLLICCQQHKIQKWVDSYLAEELQLGCIVHISDPSALPFFQYSPFGVIPKKYKPGKWRLIFNLSAPHNHAVKDAILKEALLTIPCFGGWCGFFNPADGVYLAVCGDKKGPLFHFDDGRSSMRERFM